MLPIHEFILWNNCPNNCKFCWQKKERQQTYEERIQSLELVYENVKTLKDTHVLYVGGEIFAEIDTTINSKLFDLFKLTCEKMQKNEIDLCYINTNILYKLDTLLLPVLELIKSYNLLNKVHFTTSGDESGRFSNEKIRSLFYKNLKEIRELYPELLIYVNIILTDSFCNSILDDSFNIASYMNEYKVEVNTLPYIKFGKDIAAPTREKVFKAILHLNEQLPGYGIQYCNNFLLNQNIVLQKSENGVLVNISSDKSPCTHSENFTRCYSDSNECFICDCGKLKDLMEKM
jgi:organic radical activating enzyme